MAQRGRPKGRKNNATIEREELAKSIEARSRGKLLGKEIIEKFMEIAAGYAAKYQPRDGNTSADENKFERWAKLAVMWGAQLAPYQSPTFRAIVTPTQQERTETIRSINDMIHALMVNNIRPDVIGQALLTYHHEQDDGEPKDDVLDIQANERQR